MDTKWNSTGPDEGLEQLVAGEVREALKGVEDAPGVAKVRVSGKTCGRLRAAAGLAALVLGVSLVLGSLGQMAGRLASGVDSGSFGSGWWSTDWQETPAFRQEVAQRLRAFLAMATGSDLEWWDTASGDTYIVSREGESFYEWGVTDTSSETAWVEENTATAAPDKHYAADKNLLYQVLGPERELLYSNVPAGAEISSSQNLPEGYNFLLVFRHGRILLRKDGEPVDVYGDGFYTEDSLWDVPGYENFTAGEDAADVTVYMALRQEPVPYLQLNSGGQTRFYDDFYGLYQHIREMQGFYLLRAVLCAAGAVCLIAAHFLRAERRRAEKKLAALTRRVPGEIWWLAAALAVLSMVFSTGFGGYSPFEFWYYGWVGPTVTDALRLAALLPANAPALLALVWALWLRHITRKNTEREQRRSLLRGLKNAFLARDLKLPVQKRLRRRSLVRNLALWAIMLTAVLCCVPVYEMLWNSSLTVICVFVPAFALIGVLEIFWIRRDWTLARDIGLLADQVTAIRDGDLETPLDLPADADLHQTAEQLNDIQAGLHRALAEQTRSERMKVELISNVSHDLKTPLTSVLSYAELLRQEPLEGAAADYARIIDEKARRLAVMVQDVFEVSKAASGQLPVHLERLDFAKLLRQTLADLEGPISQSGLTFRMELPEIPVMITADGRRLYRVFQNLIDNALKYALAGSRVYLSLKTEVGRAEASLRNTSREELPTGVDLTARFVRGDASRTDGGSGLGLSIASSFTEACGGDFHVETLADLFTAVVSFPLAEEP
ncbi:HAMP domain-containing sensor histidine kinase [uncultured Oscillibacter sp.]|uniref:sensor histidine kinase n=2 Tax=Dysosmobacter welbionis TaxID=2093857 RepID=UPI00266E9040|nr:HAMP domain-containing sensor histidine kinase [uncultured Oscillibacter sp.]